MWIVLATSTPIPVPAPPLIDSTVIVAAITVAGGLLLALMNRPHRKTEPAAPAPEHYGADSAQDRLLGEHDAYIRMHKSRLDNHQNRLRAMEKILGLEPADDQ